MKIAIIGGGISSISCAYFLKDFDITVFEKEEYVGGMASSFKLDNISEPITNTYHHILDGDDEIVNLIKELGLIDKLRFKKIKNGFLYKNKIRPFSSIMEILRFPLSLKDKIRIAKFMLHIPKDYGDQNAEEWLIKKLGQNAYDVMFKKLIENKFHKPVKDIAASWVATRLVKESASARKEFGYLEGGLNQFTDGLTKQCKAKILLNTEVRSIKKIGKKYQVNYITDNKSNTGEFDIIISTIPPAEFNKINEDFKIQEVDYLSCVCATFITDTPISDCYWINILDDMPFSVIFVHNNLYSGFDKNIMYILKYFPKGSNDELDVPNDSYISKRFLDSIKKIIPKFNLLYSKIYRVPFAEAIYTPDFKNTEDKIDGIYFTGIYKFYPMIRNMNSCISEAKRIAKLIRSDNL